MSLFGRKVFAY